MSDDNRTADAEQLAMNRKVKEIQHHAGMIFDLMMPGMTIDIACPDNTRLFVPSDSHLVRRLVITRPTLIVKVQPK
jgi:hypothetical protein